MNTNRHVWSHLAQFFVKWEISAKNCRENQSIRFMFNNFPHPENRAVNEIMWKNILQRGRLQWKCGACALHARYLRLQTHTQYVILIAFPLQNWLHERAPILRYAYIACLVHFYYVEYNVPVLKKGFDLTWNWVVYVFVSDLTVEFPSDATFCDI